MITYILNYLRYEVKYSNHTENNVLLSHHNSKNTSYLTISCIGGAVLQILDISPDCDAGSESMLKKIKKKWTAIEHEKKIIDRFRVHKDSSSMKQIIQNIDRFRYFYQ